MFNEAIMLDGDSVSHLLRLGYLEAALGNLDVVLKFNRKQCELDSTYKNDLNIYNAVARKEEAYIYAERIIEI